jgi:hypothetical protein
MAFRRSRPGFGVEEYRVFALDMGYSILPVQTNSYAFQQFFPVDVSPAASSFSFCWDGAGASYRRPDFNAPSWYKRRFPGACRQLFCRFSRSGGLVYAAKRPRQIRGSPNHRNILIHHSKLTVSILRRLARTRLSMARRPSSATNGRWEAKLDIGCSINSDSKFAKLEDRQS